MNLRTLLIVLGALLLALVGILWVNRPAPLPVSLVATTPTRCVIDLISAPSQTTCTIDGDNRSIPGTPTRFLVFESRGEAAVVGWVEDKTKSPDEILTLYAKQASRIAAWPDRQQPNRISVSTAHGYGPQSVVHTLTVDYTP